jgi:hypothetical protein
LLTLSVYSSAVGIDDTQLAAAEAHDVSAALVGGQADQLAGQRLADEYVPAAPFDLACVRTRRTS